MKTNTSAWLDDSGWCEQATEFIDRLPEQQRRWLAALVAAQIGWGGVTRVCELFGIDPGTVKAGREELESGLAYLPLTRIRRSGAGRKPIELVDPEAEAELLRLVDPETAGDPCSSKKWARQTPERLAKALKKKGHKISRETVRRLLKKGGIRYGAIASASRAPRTQTGTGSSTT